MTDSFPPLTTHEREVRALLNILSSVIPDRSAVYVSVPITSGRRLGEWLRSRNHEFDPTHPESYAEFQREVLEPNSDHARSVIGSFRRHFDCVVIDPSALKDIDGWTQDDYRYLWAGVIEQYARSVVFIDGWQYSNGCCYEFLVSYQPPTGQCPKVLNEKLEPLSPEHGLELMKAAIEEMKEAGLATQFLEMVAEQLTSIALQETCVKP